MRRAFGRYQTLPAGERAQLRRRFEAMSPAERRAFNAGMRAADERRNPPALRHLPAAEREATFRMMESLSAAERAAFWQRMQPLSRPEKESLRQRLLAMSPEQRRDFLLDPER